MKNQFILFFVLSCIFVGCRDSAELLETPKNPQMRSHKIEIDQALDIAESMFNYISPETKSVKRDLKSVSCIKDEFPTRTDVEIPDTLLYLFNYSDGFALIAADDRLAPVYAISDEGELNLNDTIQNEGLKIFFTNLKPIIYNTLIQSDDTETRGFQWPGGGYDPNRDYDKYGPLLKTKSSLFGQLSPYNTYVNQHMASLGYPGSYKTGCGPTAICAYMSYFKYPTQYDGKDITWEQEFYTSPDGEEYMIDSMAYLMYKIGLSYNAQWGVSATSMNYSDFVPTFEKMGYTSGTTKEYFDETIVKNYIKTSTGPILVVGRLSSDITKGHAWIIDGYTEYVGVVIRPNEKPLYHCIWGWEGKNNGYFYLYNDTLGIDHYSSLDNKELSISEGMTFNELRIYYGFKPGN